MTSLFSAEGIWFWTVGLKIYFPHFPISFSSGWNAVMIGSLSPKPSMFPLLGFSLITAISGILHCNPSPDIWLSSTEYILLGNPMCKLISGHELKRFHRCGMLKIFQMSALISGFIFDMPLESTEEDPGLQNVAVELFESGISWILSTGTSKLWGAFHHCCNKNDPFFFPQTEEYNWLLILGKAASCIQRSVSVSLSIFLVYLKLITETPKHFCMSVISGACGICLTHI